MFQPLQDALSTFLNYLPQLIGAIIILIVGYIIARVLMSVVARLLQGIGFDRWMERAGIKQVFDRAETRETPATVIGKLIFWFVFIIAIVMATDALGIPQVSEVFAQLIAYIPNIIAAILILILAALTQLGIAVQLTANTFLIVLGAVALAVAIAFGLGSREVARDIVEKAYDRRDEAQGGAARGTSTQSTSAGGREGETGPTAHRLDRNE